MPLTSVMIALDKIGATYLDNDAFLMQRDILPDVFQGFDDNDFLSFFEFTNRRRKSVNTTYHHFENGSNFRACTVSATASTGSVSQVVITLAATSHTTIGGVNRSPIKVGDMVIIGGLTGVHGRVNAKDTTTPNAHTITVLRRVGETASILAAASTGANVIKYTTSFAPGTVLPTEMNDSYPTRFTAAMQLTKKIKKLEGDAISNLTEVEWQGKKNYYYKAALDLLTEVRAELGFAMFLSPGGVVNDENGKPAQLMTGLDAIIKNLGNDYNYNASVAGFDFADVAAIIDYIKANHGGNEYLGSCGYKFKLVVDNFVKTQTTNGGILYYTFGQKDASDAQIRFGISSFVHGGVTFGFKVNDAYAHAEVTTPLGYADICHLIPMERQKLTMGGQSEMVPSMQIRFKVDAKGNDRSFEQWENDKTTLPGGEDAFQISVQAQQGPQYAMVNKMIRIKNA